MPAVIFDLDGTLIESPTDIKRMKKSLIDYAANLGLRNQSISTEDTTVDIVKRIRDYLIGNGAMKQFIGKVMKELNEIMDEIEIENVESAKAINGARETLKEIKALGLKIGVLTRSCETYCKRTLKITGMLQFIDAIEARKDLFAAKPNPISLLNLCLKMGVEPKDVIFIGDHPLDMECASNAEVYFIGVTNKPEKRKLLKEKGCKLILKELKDVLPIIKERFGLH